LVLAILVDFKSKFREKLGISIHFLLVTRQIPFKLGPSRKTRPLKGRGGGGGGGVMHSYYRQTRPRLEFFGFSASGRAAHVANRNMVVTKGVWP